MNQTSFETFQDLATQGTFVPVCREVRADLLTPLSAFLKVAENADSAFLFESVEGGEQVARYSFLGKDPFITLRSQSGVTSLEEGSKRTVLDGAFLDQLRKLMSEYQAPVVPGLPRFTGGAVGFLGYEAAAWFEPSLDSVWTKKDTPANVEDDAAFMLFDTILAFDHAKHRILIIANARVGPGIELEPAYQLACAKVHFLEQELERSLSESSVITSQEKDIQSNTTQKEFEQAVLVAKDHIAAGDIYQVVLSQRFEMAVDADPFTVYRALRYVNPSPYMYFIRMGGLSIVGSSPEMLVRVEGRQVVTHPIAGTRPRGRDDVEDERLAPRDQPERGQGPIPLDLAVGHVLRRAVLRGGLLRGVQRGAVLQGVDVRRQQGRRVLAALEHRAGHQGRRAPHRRPHR